MNEAPIPAFPLQWPLARPRTPPYRRARAAFETTFAISRDELVREVKLLGGRALIISTNAQLRNDGLPYATQKRLEDPGVAAYFERNGKRMCFACDRWDRIEDNTRAIVKTIDALRGIARWGTGDMLEAAFTGFLAIAHQASHWSIVLDVDPNDSTDRIADHVRRLRFDLGRPGADQKRAAEVNVAYDQFRAERGL